MFNFNKLPVACIACVAIISMGAIFILALPDHTKDVLKEKAYEGRRSEYIRDRIGALKRDKEDFSHLIFILGDSTIQGFEQELATDPLMEDMRKSGYKFVCLYREAFTIVDYYLITSYIAPLKPRAIVICVNLATFSPLYENNPSYKFPEMLTVASEEARERHRETFMRFYGKDGVSDGQLSGRGDRGGMFLIFAGLRNVIREWIENIETLILGRRTEEDMSSAKKQATLFIKTYALDVDSIDSGHPYFVLSEGIYDLCVENDIEPVFYITPFDAEFSKEAGISKKIEPTVEYIKSKFSGILPKGVLHDFHDKLGEDEIVDTPGHLRKSGRQRIYRLLREALGKKL